MSLRRTQAQARRLFTRKKESWTKYVSKLNTNTPIKHVWDRVTKISGKNVCPPKRYLNGKDGAPITDPKSIANEHAAAFTDNSSSAHYSVRFQAIKEQDEKVRINFTSDNTEVYNKPFRLRDLRRSILKAKPVPLDLVESTTIYWNISLRTHWKSSKISWITSGPQETSRTSGEQPLWSPNQTRTMLTQIVTDQSRWPAACARS